MKINLTTDYATRIILYLGQKKGIANSDEISKANGITKQYVLKIMKTMVKSGIVGHKFGVKGGFYFAKKPEEVTLYDIVTLMQGDLLLNQCIADSGSCSAGKSGNCAVRDFYSRLQDDITEKMKSKTVKMLLEENKHYLTDDV